MSFPGDEAPSADYAAYHRTRGNRPCHAVYEKESPAFARNLAHLRIGPAWVATELTGLRKH